MSLASALVAPVTVKRLDVPVARVAQLSEIERYAYYMLGHLFNELMFFQKLLHFAIPKHDDARPLRRLPEYGQLFLVARIVAGKLWEAKVALERRDLSRAITDSFAPLTPDGQDRLTGWKRRLAKAKWPEKLRTGHSFHYPSFEQWQHVLRVDASWEDDQIYLAKESGNVFYAGSDAIAHHSMFGQLDPVDPKSAVDPMVSELISLLGEFTSTVEDVLGAFVAHRLFDNEVPPESVEGAVDTALFEHVIIPFWTNMPPRDAAK